MGDHQKDGHHKEGHQKEQSQGQGGQKKKESILDLSKYLEKTIGIKFQGGREATGILKGYDNLLNVVLDNTREILNPEDGTKSTSRDLGIVVGRGTAITVICPMDGTEAIANPFTQQQ